MGLVLSVASMACQCLALLCRAPPDGGPLCDDGVFFPFRHTRVCVYAKGGRSILAGQPRSAYPCTLLALGSVWWPPCVPLLGATA